MAAGIAPVTSVDCFNTVRQRLTGAGDSTSSSKNTMTGLIIYVRTKPSADTEFVQVLLPVALSYETFVCKLCVALGVQRDMVKKVVKLPDILIRTTEDVIRLTPFEKLEIVLHRSLLKHAFRNQWKTMKPWCSLWSWTMLLIFSFTAAVSSNNLLKRFDEMAHVVDAMNERVKVLETKLANSKVQTNAAEISQNQKNLFDKIVKQLSTEMHNMETNLLDNVSELEQRFEKLNSNQNSLSVLLQSLVEQLANKLQASSAKRKVKDT